MCTLLWLCFLKLNALILFFLEVTYFDPFSFKYSFTKGQFRCDFIYLPKRQEFIFPSVERNMITIPHVPGRHVNASPRLINIQISVPSLPCPLFRINEFCWTAFIIENGLQVLHVKQREGTMQTPFQVLKLYFYFSLTNAPVKIMVLTTCFKENILRLQRIFINDIAGWKMEE